MEGPVPGAHTVRGGADCALRELRPLLASPSPYPGPLCPGMKGCGRDGQEKIVVKYQTQISGRA